MTAAQDQQRAEKVRINPGMVLNSIRLRQDSALLHCTGIQNGDDGHLYLARNWPGLSTGEELVWRVLAFVNGGDRDDLPTWADLRAGLDGSNYSACETALATVGCRP